MSHHYRDRLARIPLPPPPLPPPPPPVPERELLFRAPTPSSDVFEVPHPDFSQQDEITFVGDEGGHETAEPVRVAKRKGKGKEPVKRLPAPGSDSGSDAEVPVRPPTKKRKVDKDEAADDQRSLLDESVGMTASPANKILSVAKGRGKGKQREQSADSVSATATPKGRKKPGPRKKLDNLPPATQELLGVGSTAPSVSGDVTPSGSRPPSPTLTSISATVYELDEAIPPLKRARKVDGAAMIKRVKNLEETQRKVWQNIARRDVAKVRCVSHRRMKTYTQLVRTGLQVPRHWLPDPSPTDESPRHAFVDPSASAVPEDRKGDEGHAG